MQLREGRGEIAPYPGVRGALLGFKQMARVTPGKRVRRIEFFEVIKLRPACRNIVEASIPTLTRHRLSSERFALTRTCRSNASCHFRRILLRTINPRIRACNDTRLTAKHVQTEQEMSRSQHYQVCLVSSETANVLGRVPCQCTNPPQVRTITFLDLVDGVRSRVPAEGRMVEEGIWQGPDCLAS